MALAKCPRCELNYILDGDKLCTVCRKEVKGEVEPIDAPDMCSECGENPSIPGSDLCLFCLKELNRNAASSGEDVVAPGDVTVEIDSVSTMDEIELDPEDPAFDEEGEFADDEEDDDAPVNIDDLAEAEAQDPDDEDED